MSRQLGAKAKLRTFLQANVGKVLDSETLRQVAGTSEWARRLRELRDEEGLAIHSHNDRADLKPGEYILATLELRPAFARGISKEVRALVLQRNGFTCQACGVGAGEIHPYDGRKVRFHISHIIDKSMGGTDESNNLRTLCSVCNEGLANIAPAPSSTRKILAELRRAPGAEQLVVLAWLVRKYPRQAADYVQEQQT